MKSKGAVLKRRIAILIVIFITASVTYGAQVKKPLELSWSTWRRVTKNGPPEWHYLYLTVKGEKEETYDLGSYYCKLEPIALNEVKQVDVPKGTISALHGTTYFQGLYEDYYFFIIKNQDTLTVEQKIITNEYSSGVVNEPEVFIREIIKVDKNQAIQVGGMTQLEKPYVDKGSYHPIVFNNQLLGGHRGRVEYSPIEMCAFIHGNENYKLYTLDKGYVKTKTQVIFKLREGNEMNASGYHGELIIDEKTPYLAIAGEWNAMPRLPKKQSLDSYQKFFPESKILQNYRLDLEGDGQDEVILVLEEGGSARIVVRRIGKNGQVATEQQVLYPAYEGLEQRLVGLADVEGDGIMELIVGIGDSNKHYVIYRSYAGALYQAYQDVEDRSIPWSWR